MKKVFIPILAALFIGLSFSSCSKDEYVLESTTTRTTDYSVTWDRWNTVPGSDYLYHTLDWYVLTTNVLTYGNVDVYLYEGDDVNGWEQHKLPYIQTILDPTDNTYHAIKYDYVLLHPVNNSYGSIRLVMQWLDSAINPADASLGTLTFRLVASVPIDYVIEQ